MKFWIGILLTLWLAACNGTEQDNPQGGSGSGGDNTPFVPAGDGDLSSFSIHFLEMQMISHEEASQVQFCFTSVTLNTWRFSFPDRRWMALQEAAREIVRFMARLTIIERLVTITLIVGPECGESPDGIKGASVIVNSRGTLISANETYQLPYDVLNNNYSRSSRQHIATLESEWLPELDLITNSRLLNELFRNPPRGIANITNIP